MSEIHTWIPDLFLRLIGALTGLFGAIAGLIAVAKYFREKPNLKIEVLKCNYRLEGKDTTLYVYFNVDNVGERGTQLKTLEASFTYKDKLYESTSSLEHTRYEDTFFDAHKSKQIECNFLFQGLSIEYAPTIDCTFVLHHTHNKKMFSSKAPYPKPSLPKDLKKPGK